MEQLVKEKIKLSNLSIYCESLFNGKPTILFIHGFASSTYTFQRLIPLFTQDYSIIAIDLPGFGKSEKSKTYQYTFANYARLIKECLDYFNLREVFVAGHSMGGQIALYFARLAPDRIKKLVLLGSSGYLKKAKPYLRYSSYIPCFHLFVKLLVNRKTVKQYLENVFYEHSFIDEKMVEEYSRPLKEESFYTCLVRLLRHREGDLPEEQLQQINVPTLLLWGEEDKVVPLNVGMKLEKDIPDAKLITYQHTRHLLTEERHQQVYSDIVKYFTSEEQ